MTYIEKISRHIGWIQGLYYFIGGIWPLLSIRSFQWVTGPKTDIWLVKSFGVFLAVAGIVLMTGAYRRRYHPEIIVLGIGGALALAAVEVVYSLNTTISPIYLLDAAVEILFVFAWIKQGFRKNGREPEKKPTASATG